MFDHIINYTYMHTLLVPISEVNYVFVFSLLHVMTWMKITNNIWKSKSNESHRMPSYRFWKTRRSTFEVFEIHCNS